jgi:hypothetical protein
MSMPRTKHILESDLASFASRDMPLWRRPLVRLHLSACSACQERVEAYGEDQRTIRRIAEEMPAGVSWDRLAAEMTANIRVGLAAGECVAPRRAGRTMPAGWRVAVIAGMSALLALAWWVNMPRAENVALGAAMKKIVHAFPWSGADLLTPEDRGPLVEVSAAGIQLRENGGVLGMSQGAARPVSVTLSVQGSARARYVDSETGQVTITGVYAQ